MGTTRDGAGPVVKPLALDPKKWAHNPYADAPNPYGFAVSVPGKAAVMVQFDPDHTMLALKKGQDGIFVLSPICARSLAFLLNQGADMVEAG